MEILSHGRRWNSLRIAAALALANCLASAPDQPLDEYQVKAAFIYNFAKFIQWPPSTFQSANEPFVICVMGHDPFGRSLEDTVAGRAIDGHPFAVRHIGAVKQAAGCQIMFIDAAESGKHPLPVSGETRTTGILTVGESDSSGASGVVINFRLDGKKVRFDIDIAAANREQLRISSRLLSLAHLVESNQK
jgi:hypothetical protein